MKTDKKMSAWTRFLLMGGAAFLTLQGLGMSVEAKSDLPLWPSEEKTEAEAETADSAAPSGAEVQSAQPKTRKVIVGRLERPSQAGASEDAPMSIEIPAEQTVDPTILPGRVTLEVRGPAAPTAAVGFTSLPLPEGVTLGPNDTLAKNAIAEIPKGEGYEATISANTQGKIVALGTPQFDEDGNLLKDENDMPIIDQVHRGTKVEKDQVIGVQFNQEFVARKEAAERELEVARQEAGKQLEVEVADAGKNVAKMEYIRAVNANKKMPNAVSEEEVWQKKFEYYRSEKSLAKAEYDLGIAAKQVEVKEAQLLITEAQLEERLLRSPINGQIDEIFQNEGQWLREGDPVFHIIRLDKVNISATFDSATTRPDEVQGKEVTVYASKPGLPPQELKGVITYARPVLQMNYFTAYAEIQNTQINGHWFLMPNMRVNLIVHKDKMGQPVESSVDNSDAAPAAAN